ncbi:MAG: HlyD family efflux transporter periplasmic adaptor subunit [Deltaproteobacteria bacterium]|nr:HlyD family efflux transporter periplasmic adaptor subunit [Deltaproteobacteria bacterium]
MRLGKLRSHIKSPAERERRRFSVGKILYLGILCAAVLFGARFGLRKICYVEGPGFLRGERVALQSVERARIRAFHAAEHHAVKQGQILVSFEGEERARYVDHTDDELRLAGEVARLRSRRADEVRRQRERIAERLRDLERDHLRLQGQVASLEAEIEEAGKVRAAREEETARWKRLYELEAITLPEYLRHVAPPEAGEAPRRARMEALKREDAEIARQLAAHRADLDRARPDQETEDYLRWAQMRAGAAARPVPESTAALPPLLAPRDGVLAILYRKPGEVVLPGESVGELLDARNVYVEAYFGSSAAKEVLPGRSVSVEFPSGGTAQGVIEAIDPVVTTNPEEYQKRYEPLQRSVRARIRLRESVRETRVLDVKVRVLLRRGWLL